MLRQWSTSQLSAENAAYVEELYEQFLVSPQSVPEDWRSYFEKLPRVDGIAQDTPHKGIREQFRLLAKNSTVPRPCPRAASAQSTSAARWRCCS